MHDSWSQAGVNMRKDFYISHCLVASCLSACDWQMWLNVILAKLISSQCVKLSLWSVGWLQGLAFPCACMWALVAIIIIIAVVCSTYLCGSLPWTDHCFSHHICSLLAQLSFVDHCFGHLFCQFSSQPFSPTIGRGSYRAFVHFF